MANSVPRQRWRLVLARVTGAPEALAEEPGDPWERTLLASGLPLFRGSGGGRARIAWGAPLPVRMATEREPAEIVLTEVLPIWRVRAGLEANLPAGWLLVDLYDVWLGAPALAGRVTGAIYRVTLDVDADAGAIASTVGTLLAAKELVRTRLKGGREVSYDLRPLIESIDVAQGGPPVVIRMATRIHPERGSGRPDEILAALADTLGCPIVAGPIVRERVIVAGETD